MENKEAQNLEILKLEYQELNNDWRLRDGYVLNKLGTSVIFVILIGVSFGWLQGQKIAQICILTCGILFVLVNIISIYKDMYYRDATEELIRIITDKLGISNILKDMVNNDTLNISGSNFTRKMTTNLNYSSLLKSPLKYLFCKLPTFIFIQLYYLCLLATIITLFIIYFI